MPDSSAVDRTLPAEHNQLDAAVHAELRQIRTFREVVAAPDVRAAVEAIKSRLVADGLANPDRRAVGKTVGKLVCFAIVLAGVVQLVFGASGLTKLWFAAIPQVLGGLILLAVVTSVFDSRLPTPRGGG